MQQLGGTIAPNESSEKPLQEKRNRGADPTDVELAMDAELTKEASASESTRMVPKSSWIELARMSFMLSGKMTPGRDAVELVGEDLTITLGGYPMVYL